ncbi:MAG: chorismate synthase [Clostridia bacterium]|nr:chorismate synthase [Clostridia bacterium]
MNYVIFGESHGPAVGVTLTGVKPGLTLDPDFIAAELARRMPGKSLLSTPRKEADAVTILSGVYGGKTTGTPICAMIGNTDTRSEDYVNLSTTPRPGHADYTGTIRYKGFGDPRGGGHFSGRLTAPLVFAGAVAKLILREHGITVTAEISNVGGIRNPAPEQLEEVILAAKGDGDSVGGTIRCTVLSMPAGAGEPDFGRNAEGIFSQHLFGVPAVKGVAFGAGFGFASMRGSEANDAFCMEGGQVRTCTNHSGGINGGITNGMPIVLEVALRPTPSISKPQQTVDLTANTDTELVIHGRHDPCILPRAVVVIEAAAALASCQLLGL